MLQKYFKWAQGRHTGFALFFTLVGSVLQWFHRLDGNYISLIGAIQAFVCAHSIQENYFASKKGDGNDATSK